MYFLHHTGRVEEVGLARAWGAATHVHRANGGLCAQDDGAARTSLSLRIMPNKDARYVANIVVALRHRRTSPDRNMFLAAWYCRQLTASSGGNQNNSILSDGQM
jgi:hypothetical protein